MCITLFPIFCKLDKLYKISIKICPVMQANISPLIKFRKFKTFQSNENQLLGTKFWEHRLWIHTQPRFWVESPKGTLTFGLTRPWADRPTSWPHPTTWQSSKSSSPSTRSNTRSWLMMWRGKNYFPRCPRILFFGIMFWPHLIIDIIIKTH